MVRRTAIRRGVALLMRGDGATLDAEQPPGTRSMPTLRTVHMNSASLGESAAGSHACSQILRVIPRPRPASPRRSNAASELPRGYRETHAED
jgi:hypothetical protein